jgi:hypothetical protein
MASRVWQQQWRLHMFVFEFFVQVVAYHQFLKGGVGNDGQSKNSSNLNVLNDLEM